MKWLCAFCKAINAAMAFKCHSCGKQPGGLLGAFMNQSAALRKDASAQGQEKP